MTRFQTVPAALALALALMVTAPLVTAQEPGAAPQPDAAPQAPAGPQAPPVPAPAPIVEPPAPPEAPAPPDPLDRRSDGRSRDAVRIAQHYSLGATESADDVVVIMGDATIEGHVARDLVVVLGTVSLAGTAVVERDLTVIGGSAVIQPGATVGRDLLVVGGGLEAPGSFMPGGEQVIIGPSLVGGRLQGIVPWMTRGLLWGRPIVPDLPWVWGVVAFVFFIYAVINAFFDRAIGATTDVLREKPLTAFGTGLLVFLLIGPTFLILAVSVVGIAVIPFVICALIAAWIVGKVSVARRFGSGVVPGDPDSRLFALGSFALGFALLSVTYMVPILGAVAWAITGVIGLGAATLTFIASYRRENPAAPAPARVPPPVPASYQSVVVSPGPGGVAEATVDAEGAVGTSPPSPPVNGSYPLARFRDRLAAFVLDLILVMLAVQMIDPREEGRAFLLVLLAYHIGLWTWKQTTVGGIICQLRVVRTDGGRLSFADALVRGLSSIFSLAVFALGALWILRDPERQSWHDKIAGTYVVKVPRNHPL